MELQGWVILNFYTALLLVLLLVFQRKAIHTESGARFCRLDIMTLVLLVAETIGHIGELCPDRFLILAKLGYYVIYALDPALYLFAILYINCWLNNDNAGGKKYFVAAFRIFAYLNFILVTVSTIFNLKWFYYFEGTDYIRGPLYLVRGVLLLIFCLLMSIYTVVYRDSIFSGYRLAIFTLPTIALLGAFLQILFEGLDMTYASISVGLLILFSYLQDKNLDIDYLTGALNRRGIDIKMEEAVHNAIANGKTFSAIMMDLDRFKEINDTYGHSEGDFALKKVADILFKVFSHDSYIGRFGGDEFCVITNITDREELSDKLFILDDELDKWNYNGEKPYHIEVSMGDMIYDPAKGMTVKQFQMAIDELMYIEKRKHHLADNRR